MYKVKNNIVLVIVTELFSLSSVPYNLRGHSRCQQSVNTVWNELETVSYFVPNIWSMVPKESKTIICFILKEISSIDYLRLALGDFAKDLFA